MKYVIATIKNYPDNGKHQECFIDLPFQIRKGEDGYSYKNKEGKSFEYNMNNSGENITKKWIVHLDTTYSNKSLEKIFEIRVNKDLDKILKYCKKLYNKSIKMELERIKHL